MRLTKIPDQNAGWHAEEGALLTPKTGISCRRILTVAALALLSLAVPDAAK